MKLRITNQSGNPQDLSGLKGAVFYFPYHNGKTLIKKTYEIIDSDLGLIDVPLDQFEVDGIPEGKGQNFSAELHFNGFQLEVLFRSKLNVVIKDGKKAVIK